MNNGKTKDFEWLFALFGSSFLDKSLFPGALTVLVSNPEKYIPH